MFSNLCEVTPRSIEELDLAGYQTLQEAYVDYLS